MNVEVIKPVSNEKNVILSSTVMSYVVLQMIILSIVKSVLNRFHVCFLLYYVNELCTRDTMYTL